MKIKITARKNFKIIIKIKIKINKNILKYKKNNKILLRR